MDATGDIAETIFAVATQEEWRGLVSQQSEDSAGVQVLPQVLSPADTSTTTTLGVPATATMQWGQESEPRQLLPNKYKSCDFCARRKRRCDGDGVNPCRFVVWGL